MKAELEWIIPNFKSKCISKSGYFLTSRPFFCANGNDKEPQWLVSLYPNGNSHTENEGKLCLYLHPAGKMQVQVRLPVSYSFSFYDAHSSVKLHSSERRIATFLPFEEKGYGYCDTPKEKLFSVTDLLVVCKLEYEVERLEKPINTFPNLNQHLARLFKYRNINGDVTFVIDQTEFRAHKFIVSARSPVFAAMFQHDLIEARRNRVDIVDIEPDIFQTLLYFIYTDQVDLSNLDTCMSLLVASNRYLIGLLKWKCESYLLPKLTIENCCELLVLADTHDAANLKKHAMEFIRKSKTEVLQTDGWKNLKISSGRDLAFEILESRLPAV